MSKNYISYKKFNNFHKFIIPSIFFRDYSLFIRLVPIIIYLILVYLVLMIYLSYDSNSNELILVYSKNAIINIVNIDDNKIFYTIAIGLKAEPIIFINNQECIYQNSKNLFLIIYNFINKIIVGELKGCINNILILYKIDLMNKIISFDKGNDIRIWNLNKNFCELCIKVDFVLYCLYVNNEGELFCGSLNKTLIYD